MQLSTEFHGAPMPRVGGRQIIFTDVLLDPANPYGDRHAAFIDADGSDLTILEGPLATHPRLRPTP